MANGGPQEGKEPPPVTAVAPAAADSRGIAPVTRKGFFESAVATGAIGGGGVIALIGAMSAPEEASANGMLDSPPARLNNRCVACCSS